MIKKRKNYYFITLLYLILGIGWITLALPDITLEIFIQKIWVALTMAVGSFIGGFTCEGGGAISFPIFTKVAHVPSDVARDFSLAIQSIGMSFAAIFIFLKKIKIEKKVVVVTLIGGMFGQSYSNLMLVPMISNYAVKLMFTTLSCAFGIALFMKNYIYKLKECEQIQVFEKKDIILLLFVGFVGGIFTALLGTGIDIIVFSFITLFYRIDEKIATPTSVVIIAVSSIYGFGFRTVILNYFSTDALLLWKIALPVAAIAAPLGALTCAKVSRKFIVNFLLLLICIEAITTLLLVKIDLQVAFGVFVSLLILTFVCVVLIKVPKKERKVKYENL